MSFIYFWELSFYAMVAMADANSLACGDYLIGAGYVEGKNVGGWSYPKYCRR